MIKIVEVFKKIYVGNRIERHLFKFKIDNFLKFNLNSMFMFYIFVKYIFLWH
jgi:hypothetical protein